MTEESESAPATGDAPGISAETVALISSHEPTSTAAPPLTPAQRLIANRERIEREFLDVRRICIFYGCLLFPILILNGWCYHNKDADKLSAELIVSFVMYAVVGVFSFLWREELRGRFAWPRNAGAPVWLFTVATPALTVLCVTIAFSVLEKIGWPIQPTVGQERLDRLPLIAIYFGISVCPAFFEEIAFRGLLLSKLRRLTSSTQAIWVTTLLFGIIHFDIVAMAIFLIPLAWAAGWLTHRTGSLWPAMIVHFLHNAGILTLEHFF